MTAKRFTTVIGVAVGVGVGERTVSRITKVATPLIRLFRSLDAIVGGDLEVMRQWQINPTIDFAVSPSKSARPFPG